MTPAQYPEVTIREDNDTDSIPPGWWVVEQANRTIAVCPSQLHALTIARLLNAWFAGVRP